MNDIGLYDQKYYKECEFGFKTEGRSDHNRILELLKVKAKDRVLDIGCGFGVLLKRIPAKRKMGIETNDVAIKECHKRGLSVIKADVEKGLPFKKSSFDIVIMNEVIEHLKMPQFIFKECFRILMPEGKVIITTPVRSFFAHELSPTHFSEMTIRKMRGLVQKCRFKILTYEVCGISFLYPLLENFFFKPFRLLRCFSKGKQGEKTVKLMDSCHGLADRTFLKPLSLYRKHFLGLGWNQLILAQKKEGK